MINDFVLFYRTLLVSSKMVCKGKLWVQLEALKATVPETLTSVSNASIRGFYRLALRAIDAYSAGVRYGAEEFKQKVQYISRIGR